MPTSLWIVIILLLVVAIGGAAVQIIASLGDRRHAREVSTEEERLHTHPDDPENPTAPRH
jgi:flagellar basal body-associated protein FliL